MNEKYDQKNQYINSIIGAITYQICIRFWENSRNIMIKLIPEIQTKKIKIAEIDIFSRHMHIYTG